MTHQDQLWMEPKAMTEARPFEERFCEHCGENIPYHNISCQLLKVAYATRKQKCDYCLKVCQVGDEMYLHVISNHRDELNRLGIEIPS